MGLLDGLIGGALGAEALNLVQGVIEKNGGVQGLIQNFEQNGLGGVAQSWVSNGPNQPVTPQQLGQAIGTDKIAALAQQFGINPQTMLAQLAQHLPAAVDHLTPNGTVG